MCLGIPGLVVAISDAARQLALVEVLGVRREVNLACIVDDAHPLDRCVGEWVLIHVGFAMGRIDADEARRTLDILQQLGEAEVELQAMRDGDAAVAGPPPRASPPVG